MNVSDVSWRFSDSTLSLGPANRQRTTNAEIDNTDVRRCRELDDFEVEMIAYEILVSTCQFPDIFVV